LIEIGWLVLEKILKDFSPVCTQAKMVSLLWPHMTPEDHGFKKPEFALCQIAFIMFM
jgi:hypothetical protein